MQATTKQVKALVETLADLGSDAYNRRYWCDKTKNKASAKRYMAFRFWDSDEADKVADRLQITLTALGYTNTVRRSTVHCDWATRTAGGQYVRVVAVAE